MQNEQMYAMPSHYRTDGTTDDLRQEGVDLLKLRDDPRSSRQQRAESSARLREIDQELNRRKVTNKQHEVRNVPAARTLVVEDSWINKLGETVVQHATGLLRLPAGTLVRVGQTITGETVTVA